MPTVLHILSSLLEDLFCLLSGGILNCDKSFARSSKQFWHKSSDLSVKGKAFSRFQGCMFYLNSCDTLAKEVIERLVSFYMVKGKKAQPPKLNPKRGQLNVFAHV